MHMAKRPPKPDDRDANPRFRKRKLSKTQLRRAHRRTSDDQNKLFDEIEESSDRNTCVILTAMLETDIFHTLFYLLDVSDSDLQESLLDRDGALSSLYGNINLLYAMGLITKEECETLHIIRRVRNHFAHTDMPLNFNSEVIGEEIRRIQFGTDGHILSEITYGDVTDERKLFIGAFLLSLHILVRAKNRHEQKFKDMIETADKRVLNRFASRKPS